MYMKYLSFPCVCSVDTLCVVDLKDGVRHCKVVTLAEGTSKASSLEVELRTSHAVGCVYYDSCTITV